MSKCTHYNGFKDQCRSSAGCRHKRSGKCVVYGVIEDKSHDYRLEPVDKLAPF